ncbi:MAG: glycosyltransferase family 4 protein [Verrucomicrobiia bacterium]
MRILVVNHRDWLNPRAGGVEEVVCQTTRRWVAAGHQVTLLASNFTGANTRDLSVDGVKIVRRGREEYFNWLAPFYVRSQFRDVDVIIEHIAKVACMLPWQVSKPVVCYVHHLFGRSIFGNVPWPVAIYVQLMEELALKVYRRSRFIAVSGSTAGDIVAHGIRPEQVQVVHNGVDLDLFCPAPIEQKTPYPSILWVGRIRKTKCVTHVVAAFELIARKLPTARLTIVGRGELEGELRQIIFAKGLQEKVTMTGYLEPLQLRQQMQQAWVLTYPSPKEGWGLCISEAAACGTPSVASNSPGLCEAVRDGETGFLVPHGDIPALADKLLLLLQDPVLRGRMGTAAREWVMQLSWDETAKRSLAVLEQVVKECLKSKP